MAKTRQTPHCYAQSADHLNKKEKVKSSCDAWKTLKVLEFILFNLLFVLQPVKTCPDAIV